MDKEKIEESLCCDVDGNTLHIFRKDFINLQESRSVFIEIDSDDLKNIERLKTRAD
ncbi:hypothetical protein LCGC14_1005730 [marine sediment metagenome]|uniref:Uncharacterized protein n=1 Tax=marine sediment metagenome TaxID=412755 RepID=A0A0F9NN71_9ZZZZ